MHIGCFILRREEFLPITVVITLACVIINMHAICTLLSAINLTGERMGRHGNYQGGVGHADYGARSRKQERFMTRQKNDNNVRHNRFLTQQTRRLSSYFIFCKILDYDCLFVTIPSRAGNVGFLIDIETADSNPIQKSIVAKISRQKIWFSGDFAVGAAADIRNTLVRLVWQIQEQNRESTVKTKSELYKRNNAIVNSKPEPEIVDTPITDSRQDVSRKKAAKRGRRIDMACFCAKVAAKTAGLIIACILTLGAQPGSTVSTADFQISADHYYEVVLTTDSEFAISTHEDAYGYQAMPVANTSNTLTALNNFSKWYCNVPMRSDQEVELFAEYLEIEKEKRRKENLPSSSTGSSRETNVAKFILGLVDCLR